MWKFVEGLGQNFYLTGLDRQLITAYDLILYMPYSFCLRKTP